MALQSKNNFTAGVNLDLSQLRLPPNSATFIKNLTDNINIKQATAGGSGQDQYVYSPMEGNVALIVSGMPSGTNYCIGFYSSDQTNEGYFMVYNSNNHHTVWVISGDTGVVRKVHQSSLLPFLLDPTHFFAEGRITLELKSIIDPVSGAESNFKLLIFTNNNQYQCVLDVEASIATSSYTTAYFTASSAFYNPIELIHLGSVLPIKQIGLNNPNPYVPQPSDANKQNLLINSGWQFRIRTWDVWGRPSDWGIISSVYSVLIGGGCISTSNGLSRCVNLCFDAGNPLVKFITVAYRRGVGNDPTGQTETGWYETETFRKYDDSTGVEWYQRPYNPVFTTSGSGITFDASTNLITYTFCADKAETPIDSTEAARTEPGLPRSSGSVFSINKSVGLANNSYDFQPIEQSVIDAIDFSVKLPGPSQTPCSAAPLRTIIVYANLYRPWTDTSALIRKTFGVYTFGDGGESIPPNTATCDTNNFAIGQVFGDQANPGFIAYLAGTPFKVIGTWGDYDPVTDTFTPQPIDTLGSFPHIKMIQFKFVDVPAGKYLVRLASHHATINDGNLQKTSTQVAGCTQISNAEVPWGRRLGYFQNPVKEMEVDCTSGNVNNGGSNSQMFIILDMNNGVKSNALDGYLYEQAGSVPVEMAVCYIHGSSLGRPGDAYGSFFTDHNGYYFAASGSQYVGIDIYADLCAGGGVQNVFSQTAGCGGATGKMAHGDGTGSRSPDYFGNFGNWANQVYIARAGGVATTYPAAGRRLVRQTILVCSSSSTGVPGIPVAMTKCQPQLTDSSGLATIVAHNRYNYITTIGSYAPPFGADQLPDYGSAPGNQDDLILSQKGGCEWNQCGVCTTSMADVLVTYLGCGAPASGCTGTQPDRTLCLPNIFVKPNGVGIFGVQSGGKYPVAWWPHDIIGRHAAPQIKMGEQGYVYVPNLNDATPSPYPTMALSSLQVTIPASLTIDPVFTHITFLVGSNCLFNDFFSWSADWVQYVDNTGTTNTVNPTSIRIYFQSLNEYNKQYNFKTNVAWDFITQSQVQGQDLPADIVQFIMNGDGTFLPSIKGAPVTYDQYGAFFTIDFQPELANLQNGCLFRIIRPSRNTSGASLPYYEQCLTLPIINGLLPAGTYDIPYQDSYMLARSIPVPLLYGQPGPVSPGGTPVGAVTPPGVTPALTGTIQYTSSNNSASLDQQGYSQNNNANTNQVIRWQNVDYQTTFPFFFESPSPSDLWGSHLACKGRVGIVNPYEQQYRVGTEIAISNPIADEGIVNGIGTYLDSNKEIFDRNTWGDITVVLVETSVCLVICDKDHFVVRYNGNQIKVTPDGSLLAQNQYGIFTAPERKAGTNYGCTTLQINTIRKYAGIVRWLDISGYLVLHNFASADANTDQAGYKGYLLQKIAFVNIQNLTPITNGQTYFMGGIDPKTMEYFLSTFNIPPSGSPSYINTQSLPALPVNENMVFDLATSRMKGWASYTPEYFGNIPSYWLQKQFLTFKNGVPYIHHNNFANNVPPPAYCNFFGTQCEVRITHVVNGVDGKMLPDKVKRFFYIEVYSREGLSSPPNQNVPILYADTITTEAGQLSRLAVTRWVQKNGVWCAEFLCDLNTPPDPNIPVQTGANVLFDGNPLIGRWMQVSLTNNPQWGGSYFEVSEDVVYLNYVEKSAD